MINAIFVDQLERVGCHLIRAVVGVASPFGVAVSTLVGRDDVEAVGQVECDQIPAVRRLVAAVQQEDRRVRRFAPFEQVQPEVVDHLVAGDVANLVGVGDAEIGGRFAERSELVGSGQIDSVNGGSEGIEVGHWQDFSGCAVRTEAVYRGRSVA